MKNLKSLLAFGLTFMFSVSSVLLSTNISRTTVDDTDYVYKYLDYKMSGQVLGANSEDEEKDNACPSVKPITGWIDYRGHKLIKQNLNPGEKPSSCFLSIEEANEAGFYQQN